MTDERNKDALNQARAQLDHIREYFDAFQAARDGEPAEIDGYEISNEDDPLWIIFAQEHAQDQALSVEIRCNEWHQPGDDYGTADEFRIVVCTGGPHVEIRGSLNQYSEPENAEIYAQDWFTGLEMLRDLDENDYEALSWFCSLFWFGEA